MCNCNVHSISLLSLYAVLFSDAGHNFVNSLEDLFKNPGREVT